MATPGGELQRVGEQVEEHLLKLSLVGIEVSARGDGDEVLVSVRDDGIGIAAADQARIF
jgi:signal transduction histidine kinase